MNRKRSSQRFESDDQYHSQLSQLNDHDDGYEQNNSDDDDISKFNKRVQSVKS